jgi:hypothetical protein
VESLLCDESRIDDGLTWCGRGSDIELSAATLAVDWEIAGDPTYAPRRAALEKAFAESRFTADFVCLTEVWGHQAQALATSVAPSYPFATHYMGGQGIAFSNPNDLSGKVPAPLQPPCADDAPLMNALLDCLRDQCAAGAELSVIQERSCLLTSCATEWQSVLALPLERCAGCVEVMLRGVNIADTRTTCTTEPNPMAFEGSSGTLLLSKHPIVDAKHAVIPSTYARKDVVQAHVVHSTSGISLEVYCGYSPPPFEFADYHGYYNSSTTSSKQIGAAGWETEQQLFVTQVRDFVAGIYPTLVLGSFGVGPEHAPGLDGLLPHLYEELYYGPDYAPLSFADYTPSCTICPENPLFAGGPPPKPTWVDHVFAGGEFWAGSAARTFTEPEVGVLGVGTVPLSRHYGYEVSVVTQP